MGFFTESNFPYAKVRKLLCQSEWIDLAHAGRFATTPLLNRGSPAQAAFHLMMRVTVVFREVSCGTEIDIVQEGISEVIPLEMCYLGWQESLEQYRRLVEPAAAQ
jgi:hypothetical protein